MTARTERPHDAASPVLALAALGVVFGDIGTSPLYTLKACFDFSGAKATNAHDVTGIASLLVWALVVVVCIKYVGFIMRADHDGEGGILALLALGTPRRGREAPIVGGALLLVVIVGAAMLLGDGSITPAISVISAVEGLELLSPAATPLVVPVSIGILIGLFALQSRGTERIGLAFGPIMLVWFLTIAIAGAVGIAHRPEILVALDPRHALGFLLTHGPGGLLVLGGVVLSITGVEALYADLSHFGRRPIVLAWYGLVFPSLVLCYLGESATAMGNPAQLAQPLYALLPGIWRIPAILLATVATIIASQALISGAFTLVQQAIALGIAPRLNVRHTSEKLRGQVYVPSVNTTLGVLCIVLVLAFRSSSALSAAYGLAVSCTMLATSLAWYDVVTRVLHRPRGPMTAALVLFVVVDGAFILTGAPKFLEGGWVPFVESLVVTILSMAWRDGRARVVGTFVHEQASLEEVRSALQDEGADPTATMVIFAPDACRVPFFKSHAWIRDRMRDERVVLLTLVPERVPQIAASDRVRVQRLGSRLYHVDARFGYMEPPRIVPIIDACRKQGLELDREDVSYFNARPKIEESHEAKRLAGWRRKLFMAMFQLARPIPDELQIKAERRIEVGITVAL